MSIFNNFSANHLPQRGLKRTTKSGSRLYLVTLDEAKQHLRIAHSDDDAYIINIIQAAQLTAEYQCNVDFTICQWLFTCDLWSQTISIPYGQVDKILKIEYWDDQSTSALQVLNNSNWYLDNGSEPARITMVDPYNYPSLRNGTGNIRISFSTQNINVFYQQVAKQAVLIMLTDMYENRQSVIVGRIASTIPRTAQFLLDTIKVQTL